MLRNWVKLFMFWRSFHPVLYFADVRHKMELMARSSEINKDKTNILLYNNPLPDLTNASGEEGIDRYLPSWLLEEVSPYR